MSDIEEHYTEITPGTFDSDNPALLGRPSPGRAGTGDNRQMITVIIMS